MKKIILSLALALTVLFITAPSANAEERPTADPEARFEAHIEKMTEMHETRLAEATTTFEERKAEKEEGIAFKLELVAEYAPEIYDIYEASFGEHITVHESLFAEHIDLRVEGFDLMVDGLYALKDELFPLAEAGEMTYKEVGEAFKAFKEEQRAYYAEVKDAYKADIADLEAANEANKVIVEELKAELRLAVEAGDVETANAIITELYDYLVAHVAFDNAKLVILEEVEF